jgi:hypothetical protein
MSWFPAFLNWPVALIAAAIAIPALLVLYFLKLRRREMPVSSTILWKKAIQDLQVNAPFQKLRRNLLLFLQLLLLALLLLALAKPVANVTPTPGQTTAILIDRSASMAAKTGEGKTTRLDEAKRRAKELVDSLPRGATAMVLAFDDSPDMMQTWTSDANLLRQAIDNVKQTDRKTKLKLTYQLAEAKLFFIPEQNRSNITPPDVRVFSDGRVADASELSIKSPVTLERVGDDKAGNIAVVALSAKRNYERPTQVQVFARLANFGPEPIGSSVELSVDNHVVPTGSNQVFLLPERWSVDQRQKYVNSEGNRKPSDSVEFQLDLTDAAVVKVEQTNKETDALAADDAAEVVVPAPKRMSVLLVTDGDPFLRLAITSQKQLERHDVMTPQAFEANEASLTYDAYIFDRYKPKTLPKSGNFIYCGVVPDGLKLKAVRDANGAPEVIEDVGVLDWQRDHPILRGASFNRLYVAEALKLDVPLGDEVLIDGMKGPLVVMHREPNSVYVVIAFDPLQSTWPIPPQSASFMVFWYNLLEYLAVGSDMDVRQSFDPGSTPVIPRASLTKDATPISKVMLIDPHGGQQALPIPPQGDFALPALEHVGIYKTEPPIQGFERMAVNLLDPNESNLVPASTAPGGTADAVKEGTGKVRRDLWRYLVMAGIGMLFIEWWVYTRRVHL